MTRFNATLSLEHLIKFGTDVNISNNDNKTALAIAIVLNNAGADMNVAKGAVGLLLSRRKISLAEKFIKAGANVNLYDESDGTGNVLTAAARLRNERIIKQLLQAGAHVNKKNRNNYNALEAYISSHRIIVLPPICMLLLAAGERLNRTTLVK